MKNNRWRPHKDFVNDLLDYPEKCIWICMQPQAGFTTSIGRVVCLRELIEFTPTNKILDEIADKKANRRNQKV